MAPGGRKTMRTIRRLLMLASALALVLALEGCGS
jgi:hypothetical protein